MSARPSKSIALLIFTNGHAREALKDPAEIDKGGIATEIRQGRDINFGVAQMFLDPIQPRGMDFVMQSPTLPLGRRVLGVTE